MMIKKFIQQEILLPRLQKDSVLVVYDAEQRYRDLCLELASDSRQVIDASESSIESREAAMAALQDLGVINSPLKELLVYIPAKAPIEDAEKQGDPFAIYGVIGAVFPDPQNDGDNYEDLCIKAKAAHSTEIRRIFLENPNPSFAIIDAVGGGAGWPHLQTALGAESALNLLFALLVPSDDQREELKKQEAWVSEAKSLLQNALGLKLGTKAKSWAPVAEELWRFLLFSEFVFDLPISEKLPDTLIDVPHAPVEAKTLVSELCERLRNDNRTQAIYIEQAEKIERDLGLAEKCRSIVDLGSRDTFPFEERTYFVQAIDALKRDNLNKVHELCERRSRSVWIGRGENQSQWQLLQAAEKLLVACADGERQLPDHARSQESLLDFYVGSLRQVDQRQREFEQSAGDIFDHEGQMTEVTRHTRTVYRRFIDKVQTLFVKHLEKSGWPPTGRLANVDVFERVVAPKLQESGRRVALFLIDALRYELGVELYKQLAEQDSVDLQAAYAQLPTITPVGMASLLPDAGRDLKLVRKEDRVIPYLGEQPLNNVTQRMDVLRKRYGQRFAEKPLKEFVQKKVELPATVELLLIRSNEMDEQFESNPESAPSLINRTFQQVRAALHKLRNLGFQDAVIATDHGFYLNTAIEAGDVCAKPSGSWLTLHERLLLGDGTGDAANFVLATANLGIRGDLSQVAGPRAMVAYQAGATYFHGGASLQEAVVPVLSVRLHTAVAQDSRPPKVTVSYKRGAKRITTRLPVFEVSHEAGDLFSIDQPVTMLLEAQDRQGKVVGEAKPGGVVNLADRTVSIQPGTTVQITMRMDEEFEGKFTVKALDPTTLTTFSKLDLETDYTV